MKHYSDLEGKPLGYFVGGVPSVPHVESEAPTPDDSELAADEIQDTDKAMARVGEDVVQLMLIKGIIDFSELPQAAQDTLTKREAIRQRIR